jgi:hypothetical protein
MIAATEPYRAAAQLVSTFDEVVEVLSDSDLLRVDDKKQLLCLQNTRTEARRGRLGYRTRDELSDLPACADVQAALHAIRRDLDTEPPIEHRVELVGMMLDVQGITADLSYIQYLAWKLGDCPQRKTETRKRSKPWFSLVTISRTTDEVFPPAQRTEMRQLWVYASPRASIPMRTTREHEVVGESVQPFIEGGAQLSQSAAIGAGNQ